MARLHIAVIRGGPSDHYEASLNSGKTILQNIPEKYIGHDIFITKDGTWHRDGIERLPQQALSDIAVVINALHGNYGADGKVQKILEHIGIPYTGSDPLGSAVSFNKVLTKQRLAQEGIKTPYFDVVKKDDNRQEKAGYVFNHFFLPFVVKPVSSDSSHGVSVVTNFNHLNRALDEAFKYSDQALIEEYINGKTASVGVINNFRNNSLYTTLPIHVREDKNHVYSGGFSNSEKTELERLAKLVHTTLGLENYSLSDFIVHPRRGIYLLEANSLPLLDFESLFINALGAIGSSLVEFLDHIIKQALER